LVLTCSYAMARAINMLNNNLVRRAAKQVMARSLLAVIGSWL
jgi:hypothetical protein